MREKLKAHFLRYRWWWIGSSIVILPMLFYWYRMLISNLSPYDVISNASGVVVSIEKIDKISTATDTVAYKDIFAKWVVAEKAVADFRYLNRLFQGSDKMLLQQPVTMAIESSSAQTLDFLYVLDASWHRVDVPKLLESHGIPFKSYTIAGGNTVYNGFFNHDVAFSFATAKNLLIIARYSYMVEDALSTLNAGEGIGNLPHFVKTEQQLCSKGYTCNVFLNIKSLPDMLHSFLIPDKKEALDKLLAPIDWVGAGITFSKEGVGLQGVVTTATNNSFYYALPNSNFHNNNRITEVLPSNTTALFWIGTGDMKQYYNKAGGDVEFMSFVTPWLGEDAACVVTEPLSEEAASEVYAVFHVKDSLLAKRKMLQYEQQKGLMFESNYNMHLIKQVNHDNLLNAITGKQLTLKNPYYSFVGEYAIFCSSRAALEVCIDKYLANQTLSNDPMYQEFVQNITDKSNLFFYLNIEKIDELIKSALTPDVRPQLEQQVEQLKKMTFLGIQLHPEPNSFTFSGRWKWTNAKRVKLMPSIAWKTLLDDEAIIAPKVTRSSEGTQEVFVQDKKLQYYIINGAGDIRIKKTVEGKILSEVKQIDYFHDGKLYYVFNTTKKIHVLDYNGNEVQNFPLTLHSPATTGMLVADFDGNGAYHYFVPVANGNIYGFESNGKPLVGWNPKMGTGYIDQPMGHFQVGDKDYIIALSQNALQVMRRNGDSRLNPIPISGKLLSPPYFQNIPISQRMVVVNANGMATNVNLAGESFRIALPVGAQRNIKFLYSDVWGDARNEYMTLSKNTITTFGYEGESFQKVFERSFQDSIAHIFPVALPNTPKRHIGFVLANNAQVFLMDGAGKVYRNFPLAGTTPFEVTDFFGEGVPVLIVANGASVYTYKLR